MNKYEVEWEETHRTIVIANSEKEAIERAYETDPDTTTECCKLRSVFRKEQDDNHE